MATNVGYCAVCGNPIRNRQRAVVDCCSYRCYDRGMHRKRRGAPISDAEYGMRKKTSARDMVMERLAQRDAEYAAAFPDCVAGEWRGRTITGSKAGTLRQDGLKASELPNVFSKIERKSTHE